MRRFGSAAELEAFGRGLAVALRPGDIVALSGELGAGKTTLARGILRGLGFEGEAPSPTFGLVQAYEPPETRVPLWHADLYRLDRPEEALELGLEEALERAVLVLEWPERLGGLFEAESLRLRLEGAGEAERRLTAALPAAWEGRWPFR